jgi:hypothetical protein
MHLREYQSVAHVPISQGQKLTLITVYQQTGNMSRAMRESGVRSTRTAYLWWNRFCEEGEAGLLPRSHARKTQRTIAEGIVGSVRELRQVYPEWGRRRIADTLTSIYGKHVISPAGVEAILRHENIWKPENEKTNFSGNHSEQVTSWMEHGHINDEMLLYLIHQGLTRSEYSDAEGARRILQDRLWSPRQDRYALWNVVQRSPQIGKWLLRSRVVLGHSLMNTGRWEQAAMMLTETLTWIHEHEAWLRQQNWEEDAAFRLSWGDAWVECMQYLAIVLQETDYERAQAYLSTTLIGLQRQWKPVIPKNPSAMISNVKRDVASLKIKKGQVTGRDIEYELEDIVSGVEPVHLVPEKIAGIDVLWAKLYAGRAKAAHSESHLRYVHELERMEQSVQHTLTLVLQGPSPMLQTNYIADAAQLFQDNGMQLDDQLIIYAVRQCLANGYRREASQLLGLPGIGQLLDEEDLHRLIRMMK